MFFYVQHISYLYRCALITCNTAKTVTTGPVSVAGYTYKWSTKTNANYSVNSSITVTDSANYFLEVTNTSTGCAARDTVKISIDILLCKFHCG